MDELIKRAEARRDAEAEAENWDNVRYWVGYIDGLRAAERSRQGKRSKTFPVWRTA